MPAHSEFLVEDRSTAVAIQSMLERLLAGRESDTWRIVPFNGKQRLLDRLPGVFRSVAQQRHIDRVIVVVDGDRDDCVELKAQIRTMADAAGLTRRDADTQATRLRIRLAMRELEAWFLGEPDAIFSAYPRIRGRDLPGSRVDIDALSRPSEALARALVQRGYSDGRVSKVESALRIAPFLDIDASRNRSHSYRLFLRTLKDAYGVDG